ncbi:MAG TPA: twin-arginine translocation signal domain-containing protein [Gemmataceae bacterium]|nr:twin-arginine translocation signal domain-containing protein [Gemmataceae bacterium]
MSASDRSPSEPSPSASRRDFLQQAASLAAGVAALTPAVAADTKAAQPPLPTIKLGPHTVTRLILGGNPIYGYSHFNKHLSQHLIDWHTPEHVQQLLKRAEQAGINTWQNSYAERTLQDLDRYRDAGGKMNWLCLGKGDWDQKPERIDEAAKRKPIGIAPHGALAERLHRQDKLMVLTDLLKRIRDKGVLVGLSAHNPDLIALANDKGWDVDYFMCCLYYLTRPREEYQKLLGSDLPLGEIYLPSDPPRMFKVIQATKKPCLAYKILAAGRRVGTPAEVRAAFTTALENIKPTDAMIVGMYQQFGDQVGDNTTLVRELCEKKR